MEKNLRIERKRLCNFLKGAHNLQKEIIDTENFPNNICTILTFFSKESENFIKSMKDDFSDKSIKEFRHIISEKSMRKNFIQLCINFFASHQAMEHYKYFLKSEENIEIIKGNITDFGAGFTCSSSDLFSKVLKNDKTRLYLIEKYKIPIRVEEKIISLLSLKNIKILKTDVRKIPVKEGFFKEVNLNWSLHEFSPNFYEKEELFKMNKNKLTKKEVSSMKKDYTQVLKEIKRVLSKNGTLIIKDHVLNKFYFCMVWDAVNELFDSPEFNFTVNYSK